MHEKEIWKDIPGYEGLYQVNQWGDIRVYVCNMAWPVAILG